MRTQMIALLGAAAMIAPAAAHAQNPLSSIFSCNNPNNRQQTGAIAGALIGGLLGNQINDNDRTTGTVVGGLLGAAAGSAIGCKMSSADSTRAEQATRQALNENRSQTWSNSQNGTSGRIDIVDSYGGASGYNQDRYRDRDRDRYRGPTSLNDVDFARGVRQPIDYTMVDGRYEARARVNVRAFPSTNGQILTRLQRGETFDALARTRDGWLLVGRGDRAIGYVSEGVVNRIDGGRDRYDANRYANNDRNGSNGDLCRVFDQTVARRNEAPTTQRYTACRTANGDWILQS